MLYQFVVSFALGIVFEKIFHWGWSVSLLISLVSVIVFLFLFSKNQEDRFAKIFLIIGLAFALGIFRMSVADLSPDPELSKFIGEKISFEATISDEPDVRDTSTRYTVSLWDFLEPQPQKCLASLTEASTRNFSAEKYPCISEAAAEENSGSQGISRNIRSKNSDSLILLIADRYPEFKYGDKIKVSGKLDLPKNFKSDNDIEFDYVSYLSKDKIHFLIYYPETKKLEGDDGNKIIANLYSLKNLFIKNISAVVPEPNSSLLAGVIFGVKQSLGTELLDDFKKVGLIHIVVLSGYNITVIAAGIFYLASFLGKRNIGFLLSAVLIVIFAMMVGLGATVIRACIMAMIAILAKFLGRPADALRWLFIAGFLMLLWNPVILFYDPSFQLSFMATLGLIIFSPFIQKFIAESKLKKLIPDKLGLREIISSTLAVQLFVLPLLIKMSGLISIISFVINPIVLPLVPFVMLFGALTGVAGILPFVGGILSWPFGAISFLLSQIIISITEFSASLPSATLQTGSISLWLIFIWYLFYGFIFLKLKNRSIDVF